MRSARADLAGEHRLAELEDVVARDVEHRRLDLLEARARRRGYSSASFWISWCAASRLPSTRSAKNASVRWPGVAGGDALALRGQALRDPLRQRLALDRIDADRRRRRASSAREPGARLLRAVEPRQLHQRDDVAAAAFDARLAVALQRLGAVLARLARRDADLDQLAVGEQAQRLRRAEQRRSSRSARRRRCGPGARCSRRRAPRRGSRRRLPAPAAARRPRRCRAGRSPFCRWAASWSARSCIVGPQTRLHRGEPAHAPATTMSLCIARYSNASSCSLASAALSV